MALVVFLLGFAAIVVKMILPKFPLIEMRPDLVALPVVYGAMRLQGVSPFYVAIVLGSFIDILSPQKFGTGGIVLCFLVGIVWSQRGYLDFSLYRNALLLTLVGTFAAEVLDYLLFSWQSGNWDWHFTMWVRMAWMGVLNMAVSVPLFWLWDYVFLRRFKLRKDPESRDYAL